MTVTAEQARVTTVIAQGKLVDKLIEEAMKQGLYQCTFKGELHGDHVTNLKQRGYTVYWYVDGATVEWK